MQAHDSIARCILASLYENKEINNDMYTVITSYLAMIHDPVKNYPWMRLALFENLYWSLFTSDRKGINIDFYKRMKDLNWHGDVINFNYTKESLSEISFQFLNSWEGKVSLLDLPKRLHETTVDEVKDISDTKILRLLVSALEKTEKDSRYQNVK
jgi:hypothetical protein